MQNPGYIALSRQVVLERQLAVVANNIANIDTNGFKRQGLLFGEHLSELQDGSQASYVTDLGTVRDISHGKLNFTGRSLDLAIEGEGYFTIETPGGDRYTRNGQFELNGEGDIVTRDGFALLDGDGERINVPVNTTDIVIDVNGKVTVDGQERGELVLLEFDNPQGLIHTANGLYRSDVPGEESEEGVIRQGAVETSNVNPVNELVYMLGVQRDYQASNRMVKGEHDRQTRAIREIGQVDQA